MGLFNALVNLVSATVKVAITPIAVVKDAVNIVVGEDPVNTEKMIKSTFEDLENSVDELCGE